MPAPPWLQMVCGILLFLVISVDPSPVLPFIVTEGSTAILPCHYSVKQHGLSHVCWGRDCGTFWCNDILVQTDEYGVVSKVSDRYRLIGDVLSGQMDLGFKKIQQADSGLYCCRVDIEGFFNDKKVSYTIKVMKAPKAVPPTTTTQSITEALETLTEESGGANSSNNDISWQNITQVHSGAMMEEPLSRINIPVLSLSLSLSLLLLLLGALAILSFKRGFYGKTFNIGCFTKEPRHIIHEIRTRKPVEDNIYTVE
ncbi:hypothetical protein DNTS_027808 [Danionella cerebrum]|uniref:Ig-like domain-containing protein n=1 Tax=Danionella cerebrum TaxID=2873325 RepID=A0A553RNQ9_9TELE|nr:hypothetical protein DNTS_027808 [Danionella translucida]